MYIILYTYTDIYMPTHMCVYTYTHMYTYTHTHDIHMGRCTTQTPQVLQWTEADKAQCLPSRSLQLSVTLLCLTVFLARCSVNCTEKPILRSQMPSSYARCWHDYGITLENPLKCSLFFFLKLFMHMISIRFCCIPSPYTFSRLSSFTHV